MGTRANIIFNFGEQEVVLYTNTSSFDVQEEALKAIKNANGVMQNVLVALLSFEKYSTTSGRTDKFFVDEAPYSDSEFIIDVRYDENNKLYMETVFDSHFYFGIHSQNQNLSTFVLRKTVSTNNSSDEKTAFDIDIVYGRDIAEEDKDEVKNIAIELVSSNGGKEFSSVSGNSFRVVKLTEEEMSNFLR